METSPALAATVEAPSSHLDDQARKKIADFLERIREEIVALGDDLVRTADEETALGLDRLRGERDRTANQLKLFADIAAERGQPPRVAAHRGRAARSSRLGRDDGWTGKARGEAG